MDGSADDTLEIPKYALVPIHSREDVEKFVSLMITNGFNFSLVKNLDELKKNKGQEQRQTDAGSPSTSATEKSVSSSFRSSPDSQAKDKESSDLTVRQAVQARMRLGKASPSSARYRNGSEPAGSRSPSVALVRSTDELIDDDIKTIETIHSSSAAGPSNSQSSLIPLGNTHYNTINRGFGSQKADSSSYISCKLCNNKIMVSRLSNLTNHVRRHAANKQFACPYCDYQHNEQSKVRLHMQHNHDDNSGKFVDNLTPEMQKTWSMLMKKCFPSYEDNLRAQDMDTAIKMFNEEQSARQNRDQSMSSNDDSLESDSLQLYKIISRKEGGGTPQLNKAPGQSFKSTAIQNPQAKRSKREKMFDCAYCGSLASISFSGESPEPADFACHIRDYHEDTCITHMCEECGYVNPDEWKIRLHISVRHAQNAADISVTRAKSGTYLHLHIGKCFPTVSVIQVDPEEVQLFKDVGGEKGSEKTAAKIQAAVDCKDIKQEDNSWEHEGDVKGDYVILDEHCIASTFDDHSFVHNTNAGATVAVLPPIQGVDVGENNIVCALCSKILDYANKSTLCGLMAHAKRHHYIKQYECPHCQYSSSEAAHVRSHLSIKHNSSEKPLDLNCEAMQQAWLQVAIRCFPDIQDKFEQFRFKTGKALVIKIVEDEEEEYSREPSPLEAEEPSETVDSSSADRRTLPNHRYGTRRSTAMRH